MQSSKRLREVFNTFQCSQCGDVAVVMASKQARRRKAGNSRKTGIHVEGSAYNLIQCYV